MPEPELNIVTLCPKSVIQNIETCVYGTDYSLKMKNNSIYIYIIKLYVCIYSKECSISKNRAYYILVGESFTFLYDLQVNK